MFKKSLVLFLIIIISLILVSCNDKKTVQNKKDTKKITSQNNLKDDKDGEKTVVDTDTSIANKASDEKNSKVIAPETKPQTQAQPPSPSQPQQPQPNQTPSQYNNASLLSISGDTLTISTGWNNVTFKVNSGTRYRRCEMDGGSLAELKTTYSIDVTVLNGVATEISYVKRPTGNFPDSYLGVVKSFQNNVLVITYAYKDYTINIDPNKTNVVRNGSDKGYLSDIVPNRIVSVIVSSTNTEVSVSY